MMVLSRTREPARNGHALANCYVRSRYSRDIELALFSDAKREERRNRLAQ
jgi:hypothetical protein